MQRAYGVRINGRYVLNSPADMPENITQRHILLIEDNKSDIVLVNRMIRNAAPDDSFDVTDVPRMIDALELLDKTTFDLILLDLSLLDIDGTASVAAIHASVPNIPIIVYSGTADPKQKQEALLCGARHFLVKGRESPFSFKFMLQQALNAA